jgi:hypothetical protein
VALWLVSTLAQAADCCCGPEALSSAHVQAGASVGVHEAAHSLADHHDTHDLDAGAAHAHDDGTAPDSDRGCSEAKRPDANLQSNWALYVAPDSPEQSGPVRVELSLASAMVRASAVRPPGIPPPSLNPFLSTVRLLL